MRCFVFLSSDHARLEHEGIHGLKHLFSRIPIIRTVFKGISDGFYEKCANIVEIHLKEFVVSRVIDVLTVP